MEAWRVAQEQSRATAPVYPAYVRSINHPEEYGKYFLKHGFVFGSNQDPSGPDCGKIYRKIECSRNHEHHPSFRHLHCNDPGCPICYPKYASKNAKSVTRRVLGYKTVRRRKKMYHLIHWAAQIDGKHREYANLAEAMEEGKRLLKIMRVEASATWYHPYRIRPELKPVLRRYRRAKGLDGKVGFWTMAHDDVLGLGGLEQYVIYAPHWHSIASGYLMNSHEFCDITGGAGYKKRRYLETEEAIESVAYYISTHAAREPGKHSVIYVGDISYRKLACKIVSEILVPVLCADCGSDLFEFDVDEEGQHYRNAQGEIAGPLRQVMEKKKNYVFWIRGEKQPDRIDGAQCRISEPADAHNL
jgi:hypothetical protein